MNDVPLLHSSCSSALPARKGGPGCSLSHDSLEPERLPSRSRSRGRRWCQLGGRIRVRGRRLDAARSVPDPRGRGGDVLRDRAEADGRERAGGRCAASSRTPSGRSARSWRSATQGRAPKNDPAVFALAIAAGTGHTAAALEALPKVCRIGTHLFQFAEAVQGFRGWGRGLRKAVAAWYEGESAEDLAYQVGKYQRRDGWSHRDLLRLAHPATADPAARRSTAGPSAGARRWAATVKRGESVASYPDVTAACRACSPRWTRRGRPIARRVIRLIREARPAPRVRPDGAPQHARSLGGAAGDDAAHGDGPQPRQDDGGRPAQADVSAATETVAIGSATASTSASRGCTRWRSCSAAKTYGAAGA